MISIAGIIGAGLFIGSSNAIATAGPAILISYAMTGLPKGPIANPGRLSILAVLHPAGTNALYFVADGKGGHIFADTLEQHNQNVRKWFEIRRARGEI